MRWRLLDSVGALEVLSRVGRRGYLVRHGKARCVIGPRWRTRKQARTARRQLLAIADFKERLTDAQWQALHRLLKRWEAQSGQVLAFPWALGPGYSLRELARRARRQLERETRRRSPAPSLGEVLLVGAVSSAVAGPLDGESVARRVKEFADGMSEALETTAGAPAEVRHTVVVQRMFADMGARLFDGLYRRGT